MRPILVANFATVVGGGELGLELLAAELGHRGVDPLILIPGRGPVGERFERRIISPSITGGALDIRHHAAGADLIHTMGPRGIVAATLARTGKPVIFHALVDFPNDLDELIVEIADVVICNSHATAARFPAGRARVIYNGVPEPRVPPRTLGLTAGCKHIGVIARPVWWKGQPDLIPVVEAIVEEREDLDVVFAGRPGGPIAEAILACAQHPSRRVHMINWIPNIRDHLGEFDLLVLPSVYEGFCRVAAEALRAGVPVVARRTGGLKEVLDGVTDPWLPDDRAAWKDAILSRLDHPPDAPARLQQLGARFNMETYVDQILQVYEELTGADNGGGARVTGG